MNQLDIFDAQLGKDLRDLAIQRVGDKYEPWCELAARQLFVICKTYREFTSDDLWQYIRKPDEPRAMGAVLTAARKKGWIAPTDRFRPSTRAVCHRNPKRIWRSLL